VGGELPIPVAQNTSLGAASVTVAFKPFGIQLTVRPKIAPDNRISLTVTPEVSDIDSSRGITTGGVTIPAITVRRATTTVHVENGQSLAIGGLFSSNVARVVREIPLLSKIPILGELFKSKSFQDQQTELIIVVTPQVLEKGVAIPMPQQSGK
jgi:pilus assembly protein CpaC